MFLGLLVHGFKLLLEMPEFDSFPSIHNVLVDGIPENYVHYYKKYLYEIEIIRCKENSPISLRSYDILASEKERQLVINFKFDEK
jgi:hypothetical protein